MARRILPLMQQSVTLPLKRKAPHGARSCTERWLQRDLTPNIHGKFCSAKRDQASAAITIRRASPAFQSRLLVLIASASALLWWNAFSAPTNKTRFDDHSLANEDEWSKVNRLIRRAAFYSDKGEHAEVYEAMQLALQECDRMGLRTDEPFVLRIYIDSARALFKQGLHEEALEILQHIPEMCKVALGGLDGRGIDADEMHKDYLDRSSKIARDVTYEEYQALQWGRKQWFKLLVQSEMMRSHIWSAVGKEEQAVDKLISIVTAIEKEMGHDYSKAPGLPDSNGSLSKLEIFSVLEVLRSVLMWQGIGRALPFSQRILALMQSTENERKSCAVVDAMRWLAINLAGVGVDVELREGNRTARASQLYTEARQWAEQALDTAASIGTSGDSGDHPLLGPVDAAEAACETSCIATLNLLAGMSLFIDKDEKEGKRVLEEALSRARLLEEQAQIAKAEGFLQDLDAGTVGSEETLSRDAELFGYVQRLGRERRQDSSRASDEQREEKRGGEED